jgi:cell division protein FtsI (penicillin-binding protein 3)
MKEPRDDNPCRPRHFKPPACTPAPLEGPAKQSLETSHTRLIIAGALFCLAFLAVSVRLVEVSGFKSGDTPVAHSRVSTTPEPSRADIVDRNGVLLATTLQTPSLYANPRHVIDAKYAAQQLVTVLPDLDEADVYAKLTSDRGFVWLKRQLTPRQQYEVNRLGIPGLRFRDEEKRVYPKGHLFSHVLGYTSIDNKGLAGVERGLDDTLRHSHAPVRLSVDSRLQYILRDEIAKQIAAFTAIGGTGIIMDVHTGEVLAMVSLPDFDPNNLDGAMPDELFNRATLGIYEMGSVFKIFTAATALETHTDTMTSGYDATHPIRIGRFMIHDDHAQRRWLSLPEIFMYSSNIGAAKMAVDIGSDRQREYLARLGLLTTPKFELHELGSPLYPDPAHWSEVSTMTIGFGHGISVSPLQLVSAVSAVVNGGILHRATLIDLPPGAEPVGTRVFSEKTSVEMRKLMRLVVEHGTGKLAEAPGYLVGGKTGTAEKVAGNRYERHALLSSFVGAFPINDPRYLVLVSIDEPHGNAKSFGYATAGWVAAPAVSHTVERMASLVGIQPVDENSPEIRRSLMVELPSPQGRKLAAN